MAANTGTGQAQFSNQPLLDVDKLMMPGHIAHLTFANEETKRHYVQNVTKLWSRIQTLPEESPERVQSHKQLSAFTRFVHFSENRHRAAQKNGTDPNAARAKQTSAGNGTSPTATETGAAQTGQSAQQKPPGQNAATNGQMQAQQMQQQQAQMRAMMQQQRQQQAAAQPNGQQQPQPQNAQALAHIAKAQQQANIVNQMKANRDASAMASQANAQAQMQAPAQNGTAQAPTQARPGINPPTQLSNHTALLLKAVDIKAPLALQNHSLEDQQRWIDRERNDLHQRFLKQEQAEFMMNAFEKSIAGQDFKGEMLAKLNQRITEFKRGYAMAKKNVEEWKIRHKMYQTQLREAGESQAQSSTSEFPSIDAVQTEAAGQAQVRAEGANNMPTSSGTQAAGATSTQTNDATQSMPASRPVTAGVPQPQTTQINPANSFPLKVDPTQTFPPSFPSVAQSQAPGSAVALTHQQAIDNARLHQQPQPQGAPPTTGVPAPTTMPKRQFENRPLSTGLTPLQAVSMPAARPTLQNGPSMGGAGPMNQPAVQKHPGYVLEGEGERVLSKRKLEELVRQVTGGGAGDASESLDPEVTEALLEVADEFVDNVISAACKLAKTRSSSQLEIRDLQLILERNYNVRVPGYATDELRTVKKIQPSVAWTQKVSAIQAAKLTGPKVDA